MCPKPFSSQSPMKSPGMSWWYVKARCLYLRADITFLVYGLPLAPCSWSQPGGVLLVVTRLLTLRLWRLCRTRVIGLRCRLTDILSQITHLFLASENT